MARLLNPPSSEFRSGSARFSLYTYVGHGIVHLVYETVFFSFPPKFVFWRGLRILKRGTSKEKKTAHLYRVACVQDESVIRWIIPWLRYKKKHRAKQEWHPAILGEGAPSHQETRAKKWYTLIPRSKHASCPTQDRSGTPVPPEKKRSTPCIHLSNVDFLGSSVAASSFRFQAKHKGRRMRGSQKAYQVHRRQPVYSARLPLANKKTSRMHARHRAFTQTRQICRQSSNPPVVT